MANKKRPKRRNTRLARHRPAAGRKRVLQPPLRTIPLASLRWAEDLAPDFIWAGGLVVDDPDQGLMQLSSILDSMREYLQGKGVSTSEGGLLLDGGLVAFESVPTELRAGLIAHLQANGLAEACCSEGFAHAISMYPGAPGGWLAGVVPRGELGVDSAKAERYLAPVVGSMISGRSPQSTAVKVGVFRSLLVQGYLSFARDAVPTEGLLRYPFRVTQEERQEVEAFIRASFAALADADGQRHAQKATWGEQFWRANWNLYPCLSVSPSEVPPPADDVQEPVSVDQHDSPQEAGETETAIAGIWDEFQRVAYARDPDLYEPDRYEVVTGLTAHGLRIAVALVTHPGFWIGEFSAALLRVVSEILIVLAWLRSTGDSDPATYVQFKDFGRGRLKLLKLHAEDFADQQEDGDVAAFVELIQQLDDEVNEEMGEEFQEISLEATFAGLDIRKMAFSSSMEWPYRLAYAPMSSVIHSEWPILARYAMQRCANPLHRFHWVPRRNLTPARLPSGGQTAVAMAAQLLEVYKALLAGS